MNGKEMGKNIFAGAGAVLVAVAVVWVFTHASTATPHPILTAEMESNYEKIQLQLENIDGKLDRALGND